MVYAAKRNDLLEKQIQKEYDAVPDYIKENIGEAYSWAVNKLMRFEGEGHLLYVTADLKGRGVVCSFAKPEWPGDHSGKPMNEAAEAIVRSVCEYIIYENNK